jgi:hypothetical protein
VDLEEKRKGVRPGERARSRLGGVDLAVPGLPVLTSSSRDVAGAAALLEREALGCGSDSIHVDDVQKSQEARP